MVTRIWIMAVAVALTAALGTAQSSWSAAVEVASVNSTAADYYPTISPDGLTLRVGSSRNDVPGWVGGWDINGFTRASRNAPWSAPVIEPGAINSTSNDLSSHFIAGDTVAYFATLRTGGTGGSDIWRVDRPNTGAAWGNATEISAVNTTTTEYGVSVTDDELYMLLTTGNNAVESSRASPAAAWSTPTVVTELNIGTTQRDMRVSGCGLVCYFSSNSNLFVSRRALRSAPWGTPVNLGPMVNSTGTDRSPSITSDGRELFFCSSRTGGTGGQDVYMCKYTGLSHELLPQIGSPLVLHMTDPARAGDTYVIRLSFSNNFGIPIPGVGTVPLDFDGLFISTPLLMTGSIGTLDADGAGTGVLSIPAIAGLVGQTFYCGGVLLNASNQIDYIANGFQLGIHP